MKLWKLELIAVAGLLIAACGAPAAAPTASPVPTLGPVATSPAVATATVAATASAGQSRPATTSPVGGAVDPCTLLELTDVNAATGKQYVSAQNDGYGQCIWNTTTSGVNTGDVIYGAIQAQPLAFIKSSFSAGGTDATVSGHAAFWNPTEGLDSMWVDIGGSRVLVLSFPRSGELDPSYKAIAQSLAETAVGNLP